MTPSQQLSEMFPRLYALEAAVPNPKDSGAYFQGLEERLEQSAHVRSVYLKVERSLETLDEESWRDMLERAAPLTIQRHPTRGWQSLFDTLNESKAYAYLKTLGCSEIRFITCGTTKTPDLQAMLNGRRVLCEVKTINISEVESDHRERDCRGGVVGTAIRTCLTTQMLDKVTHVLTRAVEQLDCEDPMRAARRFVFVVLHFDDWVGDYQAEYIAQIDSHLAASRVQAAEIVFCPASNLFERDFVMRLATIVNM